MIQLRKKVSFLILAILLSACSFSVEADVTPIPGYQTMPRMSGEENSGLVYPLMPPDPAKGEDIYLEECSSCHGQTGMGDGSNSASLPIQLPVIGDQLIARQASLEDWFRVVTQGDLHNYMPPFANLLTDRQRWDVAAYALSLSVSEQDLSQGLQLFMENCSGCHGYNGNIKDLDINFQDMPDFTNPENMAIKSVADYYQVITHGVDRKMPSFIDRLSEDERWKVADYVRSLSYSSTPSQTLVSPTSILSRSVSISPLDSSTEVPGLVITQTLGEISGKVVNVSGSEMPSGQEVTLHAFDQMQETYTATTIVKNDAYIFDGIEMPVGRLFIASVEYDDVVYFSEAAIVEKNQVSIELPLKIYETTTDATILQIDRLHYFFEILSNENARGKDKIVRIIELYVISNTGLKTLVAPGVDQPVISFHLPPGASNLELQDGDLDERYLRTSDGFGDTLPVKPGIESYQVMFSYTIPYSKGLNLAWPVNLPIKALVILVPAEGIEVEGNFVQDVGLRDIEGVQYRVYEGKDISPNQDLQLTISEQSKIKRIAFSTGSVSNLVIGLAVFLASLIFAIVSMLTWNQREKPKTGDRLARMVKHEAEDPETIMDAILALDDLYKGGSLPEDAYLQRRSELKIRLGERMRR